MTALQEVPLRRCLCLFAALCASAGAQETKAAVAQLHQALAGSWAGTLEYRDFSEASSSSKRTKLPTWLTIEPAEGILRFSYVYDDGPNKTVKETVAVRIDSVAATYTISDPADKSETVYAISGLSNLKEGRGVLVLTGSGTENAEPVKVRTTLRIGRNILEDDAGDRRLGDVSFVPARVHAHAHRAPLRGRTGCPYGPERLGHKGANAAWHADRLPQRKR